MGNTFTVPLMTGIVLKIMLENHLEIVLRALKVKGDVLHAQRHRKIHETKSYPTLAIFII